MKKLFLCLTAVLLINQLNAQHLRARPSGSRGEATRTRNGGSSAPQASTRRSNSRQPQTPSTTTTTTTTTTPAPTSAPEDDTGKYFGTYLGSFDTKVHDVSGDVFAVDESTLFVRRFSYDGLGPDAYFWAGSTDQPDENGFIIPDEKGSTKPLAKYTGQNLVLRLPEAKTLRDLGYISVWCKKVAANFGHLELRQIVKTATIPTAIEIRALSTIEHGVKSGPINIIDAQTFLITDFAYDGAAPAANWWASRGDKPNAQGTQIPDENNSLKPLRRYGGETIVITLPDNKTIYDFDYLGVWCSEFNVDFGHTRIPHNILVPPSSKMLGVKHESKLNCEVLLDSQGYELRWVLDGDDVVLQLVAKIEANEYMAFGLSKNDTKSEMIGADVVVAYFDETTGRGHAIDYHLESKQQCVGAYGSCPDVRLSTNSSDSVTLLHGAKVNGFTMITFKRPLVAVDDLYDQHVYSDGPQAIVWAIGSLNQRKEVSYHYNRVNRNNFFIDFTRKPKWNCPSPQISTADQPEKPDKSASRSSEIETNSNTNIENFRNVEVHDLNREVVPEASSDKDVWHIPPIVCPADRTFRVQVGPTGGKRLRQLHGTEGWGVALWIGGLMAPEIVVERGTTYNFIVETGNDPMHSSRKHPFYITDSSEGGFQHKSYEEQIKEKIYAGVEVTPENSLVPIEGRLCVWQMNASLPDKFEETVSFAEFQKTLTLKCDDASPPAAFSWTPDANTPDNLYYQCFTHRWLGWKIRVVDSCDHLTSASAQEDFFISRIKPNFKVNKENQIQYAEREGKHNWNKNSPLQNQQINKIKQKIRKNQNVKFQVKPTTISAPIAFESTRIRTPQALTTMIFKEDAIHKNSMNTLGFSHVDRQPKKQIKELKLQLAKNMTIIPTIQDRQLIAPPVITPVLTTRRVNMNRGRPRAKQIHDNGVTYVRQKAPPTLANFNQIKPLKAQYLKQAHKLDLDQINLQGGFLPIFIDSASYGQALKPRKDKKLQVTLPVHIPINMPLNLPLSIPINENELNGNNLPGEPVSLALRKESKAAKEEEQPSTSSSPATTISSLIIPQTKRILSYLSTSQDTPISTANLNKFSSQPVSVSLKVPTTLKIPKLPTTANPFISSLHPFTVKQIIKSMEHNERITTMRPRKSSKLTIKSTTRPLTSTTSTTTTPSTTTSSSTTTTPAPVIKKESIFAANFDPINFGDLSSSSYYHSVHIAPPKKGSAENKPTAPANKPGTNKLSNHQLGLVDYSRPQTARASSTRVSVTKYQPNLSSSNQLVDDAILSHVLSLITNNETPPEVNLNARSVNSRKPERTKEDDLSNVNYFDSGYEVELHEKLT